MQIDKAKVTRRKLVSWIGVLSLFAFAGAALKPWKKKPTKTVKMLTEDGKLVEVDAELLAAFRKKISDKELQNWVKRK